MIYTETLIRIQWLVSWQQDGASARAPRAFGALYSHHDVHAVENLIARTGMDKGG